MRLTRFTDYSLRVLIYLGVHPDNWVTIREISDAYDISRNHLMKVVSSLAQLGYVTSQRGPGGGLKLAQDPADINLAKVILDTEADLRLVECFDKDGNCALTPACRLKNLLCVALDEFVGSLAKHSLAELIEPREELARLSGIPLRAT